MADDSKEICEPLQFHPCDTPRGMDFYKLEELTDDQQIHLNEHKLNIMRDNQKYLQKHPEVSIYCDISSQQVHIYLNVFWKQYSQNNLVSK